jgi:hypothetical protein
MIISHLRLPFDYCWSQQLALALGLGLSVSLGDKAGIYINFCLAPSSRVARFDKEAVKLPFGFISQGRYEVVERLCID